MHRATDRESFLERLRAREGSLGSQSPEGNDLT
ncbi:hypothetical protein ACVK01_001052 [Paenibacillus sp. PvR148]